MVWKIINISDTGTVTKFGGDDLDKHSKLYSGQDIDDIDINSDWTFRSGKFNVRNPANTFSYNNVGGAIAADRTVTWPTLTGADQITMDNHTTTLTNKTVDIKSNTLALREYSYRIFKDGSTYYSVNETTGAKNSNSSFATVIQAIINSIGTRDSAAFLKIKLAPGIYTINTTITVADKYNVHIEGSGAGVTILEMGTGLGATDRGIDIKGSSSGSSLNLTANGTVRTRTVTISPADATTLVRGDYVLLRSTKDWSTVTTDTGSKQGEIKRIFSVDTGTGVITFDADLFDTYNTADTANLLKINMSKNIMVSDLKLTRNASYTGTGRFFCWEWIDDFRIENFTLEDATGTYDAGLVLFSCINGKLSNIHLRLNDPYNFQYGIAVQNCCQDIVISDSTSEGDWRHPFECANNKQGGNDEGICRNIQVTNCVGYGAYEAVFDTHNPGESISFRSCSVLGKHSGHGINTRSARTEIVGCYVQASGSNGITISENAHDTIVADCHVINSGGFGILFDTAEGLVNRVKIDNCIIDYSDDDGIKIGSDNPCNDITITNNTIINNDLDGIDIPNSDNCVIANNIIKSNGGWGILFGAGTCTNNIVVNNQFTGNTSGSVSNGGQTGNIERGNIGYTTVDNAYDSTIFKVGSKYFARKYDGTIISSGTTFETVAQAAMDLKGNVYFAGNTNYDISSAGLTMSADTHLEFGRGSKLRAPNNTVITLITATDTGWNCSINGLYTEEQTSNTKKYKALKLSSATSTGIAFMDISNCYFYKPDIGLILETTNAAGYVNDCRFNDIVIHGPKAAGVDFDYTTNGDIDRNSFKSVGIQMDSDSVVGFKDISGGSNFFSDCVVWDSPTTATESTILSSANGTQIRGGAMTGRNGGFIDDGLRTVKLDTGLAGRNNVFLSPDGWKMGAWYGSVQADGVGILQGRITESVVGTGSSSPSADSTGIYRNWDTGATINSIIGHRMGSAFLRGENGAYFKAQIYLSSNANVRVYCGFIDQTGAPTSTGDPLNAKNGIALWLDTSVSGNWKRIHNDGSGASVVDDTGLAAAASTKYTVEIYYNVPNSEWRFNFNSSETAISSDVPASTVSMGFYNNIENLTGASKVMRCYYEMVGSNK